MKQTTWISDWAGDDAEHRSIEKLKAQRVSDLRTALDLCGLWSDSAEYRIALLVANVTRNTNRWLVWTNQRIAADSFVAKSDGTPISVSAVQKALSKLRRLGIIDSVEARTLEGVRAKANVQARCIDHANVRRICDGLEVVKTNRQNQAKQKVMAFAEKTVVRPAVDDSSNKAKKLVHSAKPKSALRKPISDSSVQSILQKYVSVIESRRLASSLTAQQATEIIKEFEINRSLFRTAGAIVSRIEDGQWPASGVVTYQQYLDRLKKSEAAKQAKLIATQKQQAERESAIEKRRIQEDQFGGIVDRMTTTEKIKLAIEHDLAGFSIERIRKNPESGLTRTLMFDLLGKEAVPL